METDQAELLVAITSFLAKHHIPYMITGAWSVIYYGRPRASHDIDFVVEMFKKDTEKIITQLSTIPAEFSFQSEAVRQALIHKSMFNIIHLPTFLKLDFWMLKDDAFDQSRFSRRKQVNILDTPMMLASQEDTILQKLRWYKEAKIEKHIIDAAFVYQIQRDTIDMKYVSQWARYLKVTSDLNRLKKIDLGKYI